MKQTIEIEVPDGKKAVWKDGKIVFEDIRPNLPKTWEEFCKTHRICNGIYIDSDCKLMQAYSGARIPGIDKNVLPDIESAEAHLALMQLHQLRDCYRQGWIPDWDNGHQCKHSIYKYGDEIICNKLITLHRFLTFQSMEIAEEFLNNFKDLIEQAGDLI